MAPQSATQRGGGDRHSPVHVGRSHVAGSHGLVVEAANKKRRRPERAAFRVETFGEAGNPRDYEGPFRDNVRAFLEEYGEKESVDGLPAWSILVENSQGVRFPLLVLEEVAGGRSWAHCDHCRCIGWSHHPVSTRRYHFVVPAGEHEESSPGLGKGRKKCPSCGEVIPASVKQCACCGGAAVRASSLEAGQRALHGVVHCNGYGHLLHLHARARLLSGHHLMTLWDNICAMLRARKVSVEDVAKKGDMELRLLHSMTHGGSWYSKWGYSFGHGSYGITAHTYATAIQTLRNTTLKTLLDHFEGVDKQVQALIRKYQARSNNEVTTLGELLRYLMDLHYKLPSPPPLQRQGSSFSGRSPGSSPSSSDAAMAVVGGPVITDPFPMDSPSCRWSAKRLELAQEVIVAALARRGGAWVARHEVREAAREHIGDTGLLDFVLKGVANRRVRAHVVRRAVNPASKVLQFRLDPLPPPLAAPAMAMAEREREGEEEKATARERPRVKQEQPEEEVEQEAEATREGVMAAVGALYASCLRAYRPASAPKPSPQAQALAQAAQVILDTKQFIKDYNGEMTRLATMYGWEADDDDMLRLMCRVVVEDEDRARNRPSPPAELILLPPHASVRDLKHEAERAFQDTYCIMRSFQVERVVGLEADDDDPLFGSLESGMEVIVEGYGLDRHSDWRYEGGNESWVVDCPCGARDDDGERMISCDTCEVWQHTRCGGIADSASVPQHFLCNACRMSQGS